MPRNENIADEDPLAAAILRDDPAALLSLLEQGHAVNYDISRCHQTPLSLATRCCSSIEVVKHLIDFGANVEVGESVHGIPPLHTACHTQSTDLVELFLKRGANVNSTSSDGKSALMHMARCGNLEITKLLLEYGADPMQYDEQAKNALMYACSDHQVDIVRYLLFHHHPNNNNTVRVNEYKVDPAIWYASAAGNVTITKLLLEAGAKMDYRRDGVIYSSTPLMEAAEWGHYDVVQLLLQEGAQVLSREGRKALLLAKASGYHEVVALLELWQRRLTAINDFLKQEIACSDEDDDEQCPLGLLPFVMQQTGRRPDLTYRILTTRVDAMLGAASACCSCSANNESQ